MLHVQFGAFSPTQAGGKTLFPTVHTGVWVEGSATPFSLHRRGKEATGVSIQGIQHRIEHRGGGTNHRALKLIPDAFQT